MEVDNPLFVEENGLHFNEKGSQHGTPLILPRRNKQLHTPHQTTQ